MQLISHQLIWGNQQHNAFTDLIKFNGIYYCCFRQATNHVSKDGIIIILKSESLNSWQIASKIVITNSDLRDPKLTIHPSGKLLLSYYHKVFDSSGKNILNQNCIQFSQNGLTWSSAKMIGEKNWWLWRIRWHNNTALGIAYNRAQNRVKLYQGDPLAGFLLKKDDLFSLKQNSKGYPNESDICFLDDGRAICILRRDADTFTAQLGISNTSYQQWQWFDLGEYLGGPAILKLGNGKIIIAARRIQWPFRLSTWIFELNLADKKLIPLFELPSAGDNSYPAMIEENGKVYVSYYSQHRILKNGDKPIKKQDKCAIYLASIAL